MRTTNNIHAEKSKITASVENFDDFVIILISCDDKNSKSEVTLFLSSDKLFWAHRVADAINGKDSPDANL